MMYPANFEPDHEGEYVVVFLEIEDKRAVPIPSPSCQVNEW
jgi:hypothetical protein